jgi:hypothetical protein
MTFETRTLGLFARGRAKLVAAADRSDGATP